MKDTFRLMWFMSIFASILFLVMGLPEAMWFAIGFMWASLIGMFVTENSKGNG